MTRAAVIAAAVAAALIPLPAAWVERAYSTSLYLALQRRLTPLTNHVWIALLDIAAAALLLFLVLHAIGRWGAAGLAARRGLRWQRARALGGFALDLATVAAAGYLLFLALWGLNYRRASITARFDHDRARVTPAAVERLARDAAARLNALYPVARPRPWPTLDELPGSMAGAFEQAQRAAGLERPAVPGRPKWTVLSPYFRRAAIDGMTDPFFLEVLVNDRVLPFERPSIVAHEWAHLAGFAHEAEAGFLGWLTATSGDVQMQYSGWLTVYAYAANALDDETRARVSFALERGPTDDLRAIARRIEAAAPEVRAVATATYDWFLKAHRVESGVRSYDELVVLIAGCRLDRNGRPVRP